MGRKLNKFFSLKEASEMFHLPHASDDEDCCLSNCPPQHSLVCAFTRLTKPFLAVLHAHIPIHTCNVGLNIVPLVTSVNGSSQMTHQNNRLENYSKTVLKMRKLQNRAWTTLCSNVTSRAVHLYCERVLYRLEMTDLKLLTTDFSTMPQNQNIKTTEQ